MVIINEPLGLWVKLGWWKQSSLFTLFNWTSTLGGNKTNQSCGEKRNLSGTHVNDIGL
jgi:hypothetical protein